MSPSGDRFLLRPHHKSPDPPWFTQCQSSITKLIAAQVQDQDTRILPLPSYVADPTFFDPDGVHFLPVYGQDYCRHLIDSAR